MTVPSASPAITAEHREKGEKGPERWKAQNRRISPLDLSTVAAGSKERTERSCQRGKEEHGGIERRRKAVLHAHWQFARWLHLWETTLKLKAAQQK